VRSVDIGCSVDTVIPCLRWSMDGGIAMLNPYRLVAHSF
jgi:hypothetical protein